MKFWDTSAVVPLCVVEPSSGTVKSILTAIHRSSFGGQQGLNVSQLSCAKRARAAYVSRTNARPVMCWGDLRTRGPKFSRAKYFVGQPSSYWPCMFSEQQMPFS